MPAVGDVDLFGNAGDLVWAHEECKEMFAGIAEVVVSGPSS